MAEIHNCHICGSLLLELEAYPSLPQITSDCRPWHKKGKLGICQCCGTVQKPVTNKWLFEAGEIYAGYEIYSQGDGKEQLTFNLEGGVSATRSSKILQWLNTIGVLPDTGKLLDIGCGNGAFLKSFGHSHPTWQMVGLEVREHNRITVESIPGVVRFCTKPIESLCEQFDLVVLVYVLEHVPNPVGYLKSIAKCLKPGGLLLIEVPDLKTSPFDILIADHCTHFMTDTLREVVSLAGFEALHVLANFIPKELSLLAQFGGKDQINNNKKLEGEPKNSFLGEGQKIAKTHIMWLHKLLQQGKKIKGTMGVFGTSISATWMTLCLDNKITFFVDEDFNRVGQKHLSRPIYDIDNVPQDSTILMPFRFDIAASIAKRLERPNCRFILPVE